MANLGAIGRSQENETSDARGIVQTPGVSQLEFGNHIDVAGGGQPATVIGTDGHLHIRVGNLYMRV